MCGRDNPDNLVFCQECGQRLAPRTAPPAASAAGPPPTSPLAATAASPVVPSPPSKARPPAPQVSFAKRRENDPMGDTALPYEQGAQVVACVLCGTANQLG